MGQFLANPFQSATESYSGKPNFDRLVESKNLNLDKKSTEMRHTNIIAFDNVTVDWVQDYYAITAW